MYIKFTEFINNYMGKKNVFMDVQSLCNSNLNQKYFYSKDPLSMNYLKFLCFKFNLNYITGKQEIKISDTNSRNNNFWEFKNYCNRQNLDINNLKNISDEKRDNLIRECEKLNIRYKVIKYTVISKKDINESNESNSEKIFKDFQLNINRYDDDFKKIKEEYYKVIKTIL